MARALPGSLRTCYEVLSSEVRVAIEAHDAYVGQWFTFLDADGSFSGDAFIVSDSSGLWTHPREEEA